MLYNNYKVWHFAFMNKSNPTFRRAYVFSIRTSFSISKCSRSISPSEVKPTIAILTPSISLIVYGVEKYGSFVRLYSIFADNHGNLDNDTALEKNDRPNLNSLGLIPLASYCIAFINFIIG